MGNAWGITFCYIKNNCAGTHVSGCYLDWFPLVSLRISNGSFLNAHLLYEGIHIFCGWLPWASGGCFVCFSWRCPLTSAWRPSVASTSYQAGGEVHSFLCCAFSY